MPVKPPRPSRPTNTGRPIRSYVLRQGRLTPGQKRALEDLWPAYGIDLQPAPADFDSIFGRSAPLIMEIGFGNGDALLDMALAETDANFLGVEVHRPGVGALLKKLRDRNVGNVRVICADAVAVLEQMCAPATLAAVRLFFPDPWPKKRHHKRRIVQPGFVDLLAGRMASGAILHLATDWRDYAEQMLEVLGGCEQFVNTHGPGRFAPRPEWRPETRFERRGRSLGHGVWDLLYTRR